ncbi:unnamed protein product, partial [Ectocarpus sp. 12 AP-2014]
MLLVGCYRCRYRCKQKNQCGSTQHEQRSQVLKKSNIAQENSTSTYTNGIYRRREPCIYVPTSAHFFCTAAVHSFNIKVESNPSSIETKWKNLHTHVVYATKHANITSRVEHASLACRTQPLSRTPSPGALILMQPVCPTQQTTQHLKGIYAAAVPNVSISSSLMTKVSISVSPVVTKPSRARPCPAHHCSV